MNKHPGWETTLRYIILQKNGAIKPGTTVLELWRRLKTDSFSRLALRCWNPCVCDSLPTPQCMFSKDSGRLSLEDTHHQLHLRIWSRLPHHPPACYLTKFVCEEVSLNTTWVLFVMRLTSISLGLDVLKFWNKISVGFLALTMWEEDRWAPAKRRLTPPNAGRDSVQPLERG